MRGTILLVAVLLLIPSVSAQTKPDIYVTDATVTPEDIFAGDQVRVDVTVGNLGTKADNINVALFVDNRTTSVYEVMLARLNEGEEETVTLYWFSEEGVHTLFIFADSTGRIDEENEDNNFIIIEVNVEKPLYPPFPPASSNATWWDSAWHYRVPLTASMIGQREDYVTADKMVNTIINFTRLMESITLTQAGSFAQRTFNPDSVRIVEYEIDNDTWIPGKNIGRELVFNKDYDPLTNANVTVIWVMEGTLNPHERRHYYLYWDTTENGEKRGEFGRIYSGVKNIEFEDTSSTQWSNITEGPIRWELGYAEDEIEGDNCYKMVANGLYGQGLLWSPGYALLRQNFKIPDEGKTYYIFHGKIYVISDVENVQWELLIDGTAIETGVSTGGWIEITKNVTSYLRGKTGSASVGLKVEVTASSMSTDPKEIVTYLDSFWIETPTVPVDIFDEEAHGWTGDASGLNQIYTKGVSGRNTIEYINVETVAYPKEVIAKLYSPIAQLVKVSMPFPDPSFEEQKYTYTFENDDKTASGRLQGSVRYSGDQAVELRLQNYEGTWDFQDEEVGVGDLAGFRQNITYGISLVELPELSFWYYIERTSPSAVVNYTLLTLGSSPKFYTIPISDLQNDGNWHRYDIPQTTLNVWRSSGGRVSAVEMRLVAVGEGAESTIYIDNLGYSFMPQNATNRTNWHIENFFTFDSNAQTGRWRVDIIIADGSDYRIEKSMFVTVDEAADLDIYKLEVPQQLKEGETGTFKLYVQNIGKKPVNSSTPVNVSITIYQQDGTYIKMLKSFAGINISENKTASFEWKAIYGTENENGKWNVVARVNENGEILESNTANNWYPSSIVVEPRPDLKIDMEDILFEPGQPSANESVDISLIVHNNGFANATAKIQIFRWGPGDGKFFLVTENSIQQFIERKDKAKIVYTWPGGQNGTYHMKFALSCDEEVNIENNIIIKDIRIGGGLDTGDPIINNTQILPLVQFLGENVNISATVFDEISSIDSVVAVIFNGTDISSYVMKRIGITDLYYVNVAFDAVGYYTVVIQALDTSSSSNKQESDEILFRIVYTDIETISPVIRAISITPPDAIQVISGYVNISAYIDDESGVAKASLVIDTGTTLETYEMKKTGNKIYFFEKKCTKTGLFSYYIEAVDASANANRNTSSTRYFTIPYDYDYDGIPDTIEIEIGSDPTTSDGNINVTVNGDIGYLVYIENEEKYIYWNKETNNTGQVEQIDVDGDLIPDMVFDVDGDGRNDYFYNTVTKELQPYKETKEEESSVDTIWLLPPLALFVIVCAVFVIVKKKNKRI